MMIEVIIMFFLLVVNNLVMVYFFMKERERLIKYIAVKYDLPKDIDERKVEVFDSIILDDDIEAEIEEVKKKNLKIKLEEGD